MGCLWAVERFLAGPRLRCLDEPFNPPTSPARRGAVGGEGWRATAHGSARCPQGGLGPKSAQLPEQGLPPVPASGPVRPLGLAQPTLVPTDAWVPTWGPFHIKLHILFAPRVDERSAQSEASSFPEGLGGPAGISGGPRVTTHSGLTGRGA